MTEIFLIRHTQAEGNLYRMMQGHWDGDVTPVGERQIAALAERFRDEHIDAVYSSDLYRARRTAEAVTKYNKLEITPIKELREINVGPWEAGFFGNIAHEFPREMEDFLLHPGKWRIDGAETYADVRARAYSALKEIAAQHDGQRVAVVSHGVTIRCIMATILGIELDNVEDLPIFNNTSVTYLNCENGVFTPVYMNDCAHLGAPVAAIWKKNNSLRDEALDLKSESSYYTACYADSWRAAHGSLAGFNEKVYLQNAREHAAYDSTSVLKMLADDEAVGLLDMDTKRESENGVGWISLLWLREDLRGQGYGVQLLARAIRKYSKLGRTALRLHAAKDNEAALRFYAANGFNALAEERGVVGTQLLLERSLKRRCGDV